MDLAVQQRSELMGLAGVTVAGPLPPSVQSKTAFAAGVARAATLPDEARGFIAFLQSPQTAEAKQRHGMDAS